MASKVILTRLIKNTTLETGLLSLGVRGVEAPLIHSISTSRVELASALFDQIYGSSPCIGWTSMPRKIRPLADECYKWYLLSTLPLLSIEYLESGNLLIEILLSIILEAAQYPSLIDFWLLCPCRFTEIYWIHYLINYFIV